MGETRTQKIRNSKLCAISSFLALLIATSNQNTETSGKVTNVVHTHMDTFGHQVLSLFSTLELSLVHPILENTEAIWQAQVRMIEKHGGNLAAPLPKGQIGSCGYLNDVTREELENHLAEYRKICEAYPRKGLGVEAHCVDVGLEDPRDLY